jgi:hypothetical protein
VLAVVRGDRTSEEGLKRYFEPYAYNGETEWFNPAPEVYRYLRWLRDQACVAIGSDDQIELVTSDKWLPTAGRQTAPDSHTLFTSETYLRPRLVTCDDYYTPGPLVQAVREGMGGIDLDPASHVLANKMHGIPRIYTESTNGLERPWTGRVWLNPPFANWKAWVTTCLRELDSGRVTQLTALMSTSTMTAGYIQPLLTRARLMLVTRGRIEFWGKHVEEGNGGGPSTGHVLIYVGDRVTEMSAALKHVCTVWLPTRDADARP